MPKERPLGRSRTTNLREMLDAILYIAATGCPWRHLLKDFPPVSTVQCYFYRWRDEGLWVVLNGALVMTTRELEGRGISNGRKPVDHRLVMEGIFFIAAAHDRLAPFCSGCGEPTSQFADSPLTLQCFQRDLGFELWMMLLSFRHL